MLKGKRIQWRVIFLVVLFLGTLVALSLFTRFSMGHARNVAKRLVVGQINKEIRRTTMAGINDSVQWLSRLFKNRSIERQKSILKTTVDTLLLWEREGALAFYVSAKGEIIAPSREKTGHDLNRLWEKTSPVLLEMLKKHEDYREYTEEFYSEIKYFLFLKPITHTPFYFYVIVDQHEIIEAVKEEMKELEQHGRQIVVNIIVVNMLAFLVFLAVSIFIIRQIIQLEDTINEKSQKLTEINKLLEVEVSIRLTIEKELKEANGELKRLSMVDGLTGIANRRAFDEHLEKEWERAVREKTSLSLLLCDVDFFKKFNDRYGHQEGDECLKKIAAEFVTHSHRPADLAARYGGEEFAVILPGTDEVGAMKVGEEVRASIEALAIAHEDASSGTVTVSAGVAVMVPNGSVDVSMLIKRADAALYSAKNGGRNRVASYQP